MSLSQEEKEGVGNWNKPLSPYSIFQHSPQFPSAFLTPYSPPFLERPLEVAIPTSLPPPSHEWGPPRAVQTQVCFGHVVVVFCIELCLTVLKYVAQGSLTLSSTLTNCHIAVPVLVDHVN